MLTSLPDDVYVLSTRLGGHSPPCSYLTMAWLVVDLIYQSLVTGWFCQKAG